jgi:hypothetical protein
MSYLLQELPPFSWVPPAPEPGPLQALSPGACCSPLQEEAAGGVFGQPVNVKVLPAIRLAIPNPARIFFSRSMSMIHLLVLDESFSPQKKKVPM